MEESILTVEQLAELNPEGIEINTVVDDVTEQDTFNTDTIEQLNEGEFEIENEEAVEEVEATEEAEEETTEEEIEEGKIATETEGE